MRKLTLFSATALMTALSASSCTHSPETRQAPGLAAGEPVYGVTIDDVSKLSLITQSLGALSHVPTARIVFDERVPAKQYVNAASKIHEVSHVMGEILDSFYVKTYTTDEYLARTNEYLTTLGSNVDLWEIGNEVNGEWLGATADVVKKITGAYDIVHGKGLKTALTLYYNKGCTSKDANEMFAWTTQNIPATMKQGLDYVWISYYEDDCDGPKPDWPTVFKSLAQMFPNSKIGFGETGTKKALKKAEYIKRYYGMSINEPSYVGGYFWWYFKQDMVPKTKALWDVLNTAIK